MASTTVRKTTSPARRRKALGPDEALIAVFIGAMDANGHVAREELTRAHHLIWSTNHFRRKSADAISRLIERMKTLVEEEDREDVMQSAAQAIPARLRPSAFAVVADLLLSDGKIDARERRFLDRLSIDLDIRAGVAGQIVETMLIKNRL